VEKTSARHIGNMQLNLNTGVNAPLTLTHKININKINKIKQYVPQSSSLGERFTSRASAGESCKTYYHPGRSVSPLVAHVLKEVCPSHWAKSPERSLATERPVVSGLGGDGKVTMVMDF